MSKILRIDMSSLSIKSQEVPEAYLGLGGRGLTSAIIPTCSPIGPNNKLVFAPGLLGGTICPNSGRISVGAKSPLTGTIKEANSGGQAGQYLGRLGISAIVIEGLPEEGKLFNLFVGKGKRKLIPADELKGLGNYDAVDRLKAEFGNKAAFVSIGRAGEWKLSAASIAFSDMDLRPTRHAGRGGLGAVMGSKGLKAIIIDPSGCRQASVKDSEAFKKAAKRFSKALSEDPLTGERMGLYGSAMLVNVINSAGGLPTRNFSTGSFEGAEKVSGESLNRITMERKGDPTHGCMTGCIPKCSGIFLDEEGKYVSKWPEYETIWAWGPNCGIDDLDAIVRMDRACDDIGIDTMEAGNAVAVSMEAGIKEFGDAAGAEELLAEIGQGTPLGRVLGSGVAVTGKVFGVRRIPAVKNQAMAAYDPRAIKGIGVTYSTSPMGADHTSGYAVRANIRGVVDPLKPEGQVKLSREVQIETASLFDSTGLCLFVHNPIETKPDTFNSVLEMINARYGISLTRKDIDYMGRKILEMERDFNKRAGFTPADDRLPEFFKFEKLPPHNTVFDVSDEELDSTLDFGKM
ncbi:MAG: aldehyde ferredoxin oxidoreductase [Deltaproteobacteria bacterium]|nr:aldehyde ferredoxin oxidoreductase [Deltaproteobacteria bacterium]